MLERETRIPKAKKLLLTLLKLEALIKFSNFKFLNVLFVAA